MSQVLTVLYVFPAVLRDISERGRDLEQILSQYITFVKPAFEEFCLPVSKGSDTHWRLPNMPHTLPSSSDRSILCPRAQVSLPCLAPSLWAMAKMGVPVLAGQAEMGTIFTATAFLVRSPSLMGRPTWQEKPLPAQGLTNQHQAAQPAREGRSLAASRWGREDPCPQAAFAVSASCFGLSRLPFFTLQCHRLLAGRMLGRAGELLPSLCAVGCGLAGCISWLVRGQGAEQPDLAWGQCCKVCLEKGSYFGS